MIIVGDFAHKEHLGILAKGSAQVTCKGTCGKESSMCIVVHWLKQGNGSEKVKESGSKTMNGLQSRREMSPCSGCQWCISMHCYRIKDLNMKLGGGPVYNPHIT